MNIRRQVELRRRIKIAMEAQRRSDACWRGVERFVAAEFKDDVISGPTHDLVESIRNATKAASRGKDH